MNNGELGSDRVNLYKLNKLGQNLYKKMALKLFLGCKKRF